jgi:DNA-binding beta-propeller fold protein YncE
MRRRYVSGYTIDSTSGALTEITGLNASPFTVPVPAGSQPVLPVSVAVDPSGKFAYVANQILFSASGNVTGFTINSTTGALTAIDSSLGNPITTGSFPVSVAVDPKGKFVYVANNGSNNVSGYTINSTTGALTEITGLNASPFTAGSQPTSVAVDPSGKFVYVANAGSNTVSGFSIDPSTPSTGALTLLGNFSLGNFATNPRSVAVDPSGQFVYVANLGTGNVSGFTIASNGALTLIAGSPFTVPGGGGPRPVRPQPRSVAVDPSGKFVYVASQNKNTVSGFTITPGTGVLTAFTGSPFTAGSFPAFVAVDPSGKFVYVANFQSNNVSGYTIDPGTPSTPSTGALTEITGLNASPFTAGSQPTSVAITSCPAPVITGATASPDVLWPPNHKFVDVTIDYTETSNCSSTCTLSVTSNEPGPHEWIIVDEHHVQLLAERNGNGSGRVYTITITCTNSGGATTQDVTVLVPHDQGH